MEILFFSVLNSCFCFVLFFRSARFTCDKPKLLKLTSKISNSYGRKSTLKNPIKYAIFGGFDSDFEDEDSFVWNGNSPPPADMTDSDYVEEYSWSEEMEELDEQSTSPYGSTTFCETVDLTQDDEMEISSIIEGKDTIVISDCETDDE